MNAWRIASLVFTLISLLLLLIALLSDYWVKVGPSHWGIWKSCVLSPGLVDVCAYLGVEMEGYFHATRAFLILGMLAGVASTSLLFFRPEIGSYSIIKNAYSFNYSAGVLVLLAIFTGVQGASRFYLVIWPGLGLWSSIPHCWWT